MYTTRSTPRARKGHWCDICGWEIPAGEDYQRSVTFDGGDVLVWKTHIKPCQVAADRSWDDDYHAGEFITADSVAEWASENAAHDDAAAEVHRRHTINTERAKGRRRLELAREGGAE